MSMNRLLKLVENKTGGQPPKGSIRCEAGDDGVHLYVYDILDSWFGVSAADFSKELTAAQGKTVHLHINSPGGDVFEGRAMAAAISAHDAPVIAHIDGLVASAATYLAMAAKEVRMTDGGMFMIHESMSLGFGNATELRELADLLEKIDGTIAATYVQRTGKDLAQVQAWMAAETWFTAQEALDNGFVDAIEPSSQKASNKWDLSGFKNAPKLPEPSQADLDELMRNQVALNRARMRQF